MEDLESEVFEISKAKYLAMEKRLDWLECLEGAGLDNWDGCDHAQDVFKEMYPDD